MKQLLIALGLVVFGAQLATAQTTLRFASPAPAPAPINGVLQKWSDDVTAASNGELKIEFVPGGVMGKEGQLYDRVQNGVVDIAWDLQASYPGKFPATTVAELPSPFEQAGPSSTALWGLLENGTLGGEYDGVHMLGLFTFATSTLMSTQPVASLDDLKGLKLSTGTLMRQKMLEALGANPVGLPVYEWYQGMSRGMIDGVVETTSVVPAFKLDEVATHFVKMPLGTSTGFVFMNQARYDGLSDAARATLDGHSGELMSRMLGDFWQGAADYGDKVAKDAGHEISQLSEADVERMNAVIAPVTASWIETTADGQAIHDAYSSAAGRSQ